MESLELHVSMDGFPKKPLGIPPRKTQKKHVDPKKVPCSTLGNLHLPSLPTIGLEQVPMLVLGRVSWWDRKFLFDMLSLGNMFPKDEKTSFAS